mgnify:CR=1 FL=1
MKLPPLLSAFGIAVLEPVLNRLINMDPAAMARLAPLAGKQLAVDLLDTPVQLVITAQADGLWLNSHGDAVDCRVKVRLGALKQLSDPANITKLIRANDLDIEGDLATLQKFSQFFGQLNPDWQEELAKVIGDANAYRAAQLLQGVTNYLQQQWQQTEQTLQTLAHDELHLTPSAVELKQFSHEVRALEARAAHLQQQLTKLRVHS